MRTSTKILLLATLATLACAAWPSSGAHAQEPPRDRYQPEIPSAAVHQMNEAQALRREGEHEAAIGELNRLVREQPDYYLAWYSLGLAHTALQQYDEATRAFDRALAIRNEKGIEEYTILNSSGWVLMLEGRYDLAEDRFREALALGDRLPEASRVKVLNNLGLLSVYFGDTQQARQYLDQAVKQYDSGQAQRTLQLLKKVESFETRQEQLKVQEGPPPGRRR